LLIFQELLAPVLRAPEAKNTLKSATMAGNAVRHATATARRAGDTAPPSPT
jgi:hypothetical protein